MKHFDRILTEALESLESGGVSAEKFINFISAIVSSAHQDKVPIALQKALALPPQELAQIMNATTWVGHDQNLKNALAANPETAKLVSQLADHVKEFAAGAAGAVEAVGQRPAAPQQPKDGTVTCLKCGGWLIDPTKCGGWSPIFGDTVSFANQQYKVIDSNRPPGYRRRLTWPLPPPPVQVRQIGSDGSLGGITYVCNGECECNTCGHTDCPGGCGDEPEYDSDADYFSQGDDYNAH